MLKEPKLTGKGNDLKVRIYLKETSQPIVFNAAHNTYQKGDFFCVFVKSNPGVIKNEGVVYKYPMQNIFNVKETY